MYQRILASLLRNVTSKSVFYFLGCHTESYRAESLKDRSRRTLQRELRVSAGPSAP